MKPLRLEKDDRTEVVKRIQDYFATELDSEIGAIPAELLLNFFTEHIGAFYYNQGLKDAQAVFAQGLDDVNEKIYGLEQRARKGR